MVRHRGIGLAALAVLLASKAATTPARAAEVTPLPAAATATAGAPAFVPKPRRFAVPIQVSLSSATPGATIYYTTDGSAPVRGKSPAYGAPIPVTGTTTIKAFAFKARLKPSAVSVGTYTIAAPPPPNETGGTLHLATLTPQSGATSGGSGSASLTLAADSSAAVLRYSYSGLTGAITSQHVHAADGSILFDLDTAPVQADGSRVWRIQPAGTFDRARVLAELTGGDCYLNLHTAAYPAGEIKGFFRRTFGSQTFAPPSAPPELPPGPADEDDAARFLLQATFGPRPGEVEALRAKGFGRWLDEQMALPPASHLAAYDQLVALTGDPRTQGLVQESLMAQAVQGADQLRQRVVFALSELFVVSDRDADIRKTGAGLASYVDLLGRNAFGSFRRLLEEVTLSPSMAIYLDLAGSSRSIPELGRNPNENYAREVLQLFSIGLYQLHPDGTLRLDAGNQPIATYDQETVKAFARAFTGWTLGGQNRRNEQRFFRPVLNDRLPLEAWEQYHDTGEKRLLDGTVLPAGQSARTDLEDALDAVVRHPNVGPFVCRSLIQRLVSSNPSPGFVYRCGRVFADDGTGARGNLGAVVRAILLDYEARAPQLAARPDAGHLREPVVRLVGLLRALDARPRNGRWRFVTQLERQGLSLGQTPLRSPSVFNFFDPAYAQPGEIGKAGLVSPELQITTETTSLGAANFNRRALGRSDASPFTFSLTPFQPPQAANDEALLSKVDLLLFGGTMSDATRATLRAALADPDFPRGRDPRVIELMWLASLAPESVVQK